MDPVLVCGVITASICILLIFLIRPIAVWCAIDKEKNHQGASPTSNSGHLFFMTADSAVKKGNAWILSGVLRGASPDKGDVVYIRTGNGNSRTDSGNSRTGNGNSRTDSGNSRTDSGNIPVMIGRISDQSMPEEGAGVSIQMTVYGAGKAKIQAGCLITNQRIKEESETQTAIVKYPVVVHHSIIETLAVFFFAVLSILTAAGCIIVLMGEDSSNDAGAGIGLFCSVFMAAITFWLFIYNLGSGMKITEDDQVIIRCKGRKTVYHINNLYYRIAFLPNKSERRRLTVTDAGGKSLIALDDNAARFEEACEAFRSAYRRKKEKEIWELLLSKLYYVPADNSQPVIMENKSTGETCIMLYEREEKMNEHYNSRYDGVLWTRLPEMVEATGNFESVSELIIFPDDPKLPETLIITLQSWKEERFLVP